MSLTRPQIQRLNEITFRVQRLRREDPSYDGWSAVQQDRDDLFDMVTDLLAQLTEPADQS